MARQSNRKISFSTDEQRWSACLRRDIEADGVFLYSVRSTGIYCRPTCGGRNPKRVNVRFHATCAEAEAAGFRACKRCRPTDLPMKSIHAAAVERACRLIESSEKLPPLAALAAVAGLTQSHFHRVFKSQLGITPHEYGKARRLERARQELATQDSVTRAIFTAGYGSSNQFYGEAGQSLGMSPGQYRTRGAGVRIRFAIGQCSFGEILVAATDRGVSAISLGDDPQELLDDLVQRFSRAELVGGDEVFDRTVARVIAFVEEPARGWDMPLDIRGTAFQQRVWAALRGIPPGSTASYTEIARRLGAPQSVRAVAQACAANPVAVAIPCHRVVRRDGGLAGYRWGIERKQTLLERESQALAAQRST